MKKRKTVFTKSEGLSRKWYRVDAAGAVLGHLAAKVAVYLRGKHKPVFTPQTDCGDFIVVVNAEKVAVTGNKAKDKTYFSHSGFPGGDKLISFEKLLAAQPEKVIRFAVEGMLPHNRLGAQLISKLKIYRGEPKQYEKLAKLEVK